MKYTFTHMPSPKRADGKGTPSGKTVIEADTFDAARYKFLAGNTTFHTKGLVPDPDKAKK